MSAALAPPTLSVLIFSTILSTLFFPGAPDVYAGLISLPLVSFIVIATASTGFRGATLLFLFLGAFVVVFSVSWALNPLELAFVPRLLLICLVIITGWTGVDCITSSDFRRAILLGSVLAYLAISIFFAANGMFESLAANTRFPPLYKLPMIEFVHPNLVGLLMVNLIPIAFLMRTSLGKAGIVALALVPALAAQSRAAMIIVVLCGVSSFLIAGISTKRRILISLIVASLLAVAAAVNADAVLDVVADKLLISDEYRGGSTGLVGRADIWAATYDLFLENPVIGVGSGQHIQILNMTSYAHNMYLILLAENGLVGFAFFVIMTWLAARGFWTLGGDPDRQQLKYYALAFITNYYLYGLVEGRGVNIGNVLSLNFFLIIGMGMRMMVKRSGSDSVPYTSRLSPSRS